MSDPQQRYLVKMDDGTWRLARRDANGSAWQAVSPEAAAQLSQAGLPTKLERAEANYSQAVDDAGARTRAAAEALRTRGFFPEGTQGPVRIQRTQVEGGEPIFSAYSLDMRGNERKGPISLDEARYLSGTFPEGVREVPEGEELVPLPLPQPAPEQTKARMAAMLQALRGGG